MRRTMDVLRAQFDRVVLDAPPPAPLADVSILAPLVDRVLIVVRSGVTTKPAIHDAISSVEPSKLLGFVLNDASSRTPARAPNGTAVLSQNPGEQHAGLQSSHIGARAHRIRLRNGADHRLDPAGGAACTARSTVRSSGLWRVALITALCELCFYYNDLYDLTVVHSTGARRAHPPGGGRRRDGARRSERAGVPAHHFRSAAPSSPRSASS